MKRLLTLIFVLLATFSAQNLSAQNADTDGANLWFTTQKLCPESKEKAPENICIAEKSASFTVLQSELQIQLNSLFGTTPKTSRKIRANSLIIGTSALKTINALLGDEKLKALGNEGFIIRYFPETKTRVIAANTDKALLYGVFQYLRALQTHTWVNDVVEVPSYKLRVLNHWDNLDGSVERGYAGHSIWKWDELPQKISPLYKAYARANASIGINGTVLNNVNANPKVLSAEYLAKAKVIADELRPYGIQIYLAVNFSSPKELGKLATSDPLNPEVKQWWQNKAKEIYQTIPDFGGFLVKANSEGLPGPQDFGRTHADGANLLADALQPYGGVIMWRAFVYSSNGDDRAKQAYTEFKPLDGQFRKNVIIQVKNGPIDFQPREPFSPIFGQMEHTSLMPELQITQEYLGFSDHLAYLGTLFKEFLDTDTYTKGRKTTITRITDGSIYNDSITGIAGVANIGLDANWCGHQFAQANWYAFGRLAWNHQLQADDIATEWLQQTFSNDTDFTQSMEQVMLESREAVVNYMTPLGLHHLMGWSHHYGPEPWCVVPNARPDWLPTYYHRADSFGIGFDRTTTGSNAVQQYAEPLKSLFNDPKLCQPEYLLWFHHLSWNYRLLNGNTLWDELCYRYYEGAEQVTYFQQAWEKQADKVDKKRFEEVKAKLAIQAKEAIWWRDACVLYFQTFSRLPIPNKLTPPKPNLGELKKVKFDLKPHN